MLFGELEVREPAEPENAPSEEAREAASDLGGGAEPLPVDEPAPS